LLYAIAFDRIGVVVSDLYFVDPHPGPGQEGPEQGVRLEVRLFERPQLHGSIYSAQPIAIDLPVWRADLLESVTNPGSMDRAHHHPRFQEWEPGSRQFVDEMAPDPVAWVGTRLSDLDGLLDEAGFSHDEVGAADADELRAAVPEILRAVRSLLDRIQVGELARPTEPGSAKGARAGWL
jgi:hypothetical protein